MGPHQKGSGKHEKRGNASRKAFPLLYVHSPLKNELLGVQFDDVGFVDFVLVGEFVSLGETGEGCSPVVEGLFDVWKIEGLQFLEGLL